MKKILFVFVGMALFASMQLSAATYNYVQHETLDLSNSQSFDRTSVDSVVLGTSSDSFVYVVQLNIVDVVNGILTVATNNPAVENLSLSVWSGLSGTDSASDLVSGGNPVADVYSSLALSGNQGYGDVSSLTSGDLGAELYLGSYLGGTTLYVALAADLINSNAMDLDFSVQAVPVPAAVWLFGSALMGLVGISRRKSDMSLSA